MTFWDFPLPPGLIAQAPAQPRDHCRLMVLHRDTGTLEHRQFFEIGEYLNPGDVLVLNDTRVLPARLVGRKKATGGRVEVLLLRQEGEEWEALVGGKGLRPGVGLVFPGGLEGEVVGGENGTRRVRFSREPSLDEIGQLPLPPYIKRPLTDPEDYQTVFSRELGSLAAPTAGLHFTRELLQALEGKGVELAYITLHLGPGSFLPFREPHHPPPESARVSPEVAERLSRARTEGRRIVAVGTTTARLLEQAASPDGFHAFQGQTGLFIKPGHRFRGMDALVTNFHLPRSTHLLLVSAFCGEELLRHAYQEAIRLGYRFYSFGDGMLVL